MATHLPLDFSHPAVKEYVALIRLQVLTPLSTLVSVATVLATEFVVSPSLGSIAGLYPTSITPRVSLVALYFLLLFGLQIGYCLLLVVAWREHTKKAIVHGVGFPIVLANWLLAGWAVAWSFQSWIACSVLMGFVVLLLIFVNLRVLIWYPAAWSSPIDYLLLHAPIRLFLLVTMTLLLPLSISLAVGHHWTSGHQEAYDRYQWEGFGIVFGTGFLATIIAIWRSDVIWSLGTMWILWCIGSARPKPASVASTIIAFTVIIPIVFVAALVGRVIHRKNQEVDAERQVILPGEDDAIRRTVTPTAPPPPPTQQNPGHGPTEVRSEDIWG